MNKIQATEHTEMNRAFNLIQTNLTSQRDYMNSLFLFSMFSVFSVANNFS